MGCEDEDVDVPGLALYQIDETRTSGVDSNRHESV
jgi:hypothetical protein